MREMHTLTTPRRVEEIQLSNGGLTRALTAPARDPRPGFCVGRADDVKLCGCDWVPPGIPCGEPRDLAPVTGAPGIYAAVSGQRKRNATRR